MIKYSLGSGQQWAATQNYTSLPTSSRHLWTTAGLSPNMGSQGERDRDRDRVRISLGMPCSSFGKGKGWDRQMGKTHPWKIKGRSASLLK